MITKNREETKWLEFEFLDPKLIIQGVILKPLEINKEKLKNTFDVEEFSFVNQVHGDLVHSVSKDYSSLDGDGMITNMKRRALCIKHADCQAALFFDPINKVIANVHAGWRGQVLGIYTKTIKKMVLSYGSRRENLIVCISPSLEPRHSEFNNYETEFPPHFHKVQIKPNYFDLWQIAEDELVAAGILRHHIEIARIGTYGNQEHFFSYRRGKDTGRNLTFIALR
jgi:YfiH family protein